MFKDVYATTPCAGYQMKKTVEELQKHWVGASDQFHGAKHPLLPDVEIPYLMVLGPGQADIPPFGHPMMLARMPGSEAVTVVVDVRNCTRLNRENQMAISNEMDYNLAVLRAHFTQIWNTEDDTSLLDLGSYPLTIYARWVSEILTRRFALTPDIQMRITILAAYFYLSMFLDITEDKLPEKEMLRMGTMIARATYISAEEVLDVIEQLPPVRDVSQFCALLQEHANSARFEGFNPALLYTVAGGSWFGTNAREVICVAIEHPPTWLAILLMATDERGFRNTVIGKLAQQYQKADDVKAFVYNIKNLVHH